MSQKTELFFKTALWCLLVPALGLGLSWAGILNSSPSLKSLAGWYLLIFVSVILIQRIMDNLSEW